MQGTRETSVPNASSASRHLKERKRLKGSGVATCFKASGPVSERGGPKEFHLDNVVARNTCQCVVTGQPFFRMSSIALSHDALARACAGARGRVSVCL